MQTLAVASFVLVHLFAGRLRFLEGVPRSRWLSFAGGISVAYVFVHVFPELAEAQEELGGRGEGGWLDHHAYLVALGGLVAFYALERVVQRADVSHADALETSAADDTRAVFRLHVGMFALYNALIGYLLVHRVEQDLPGLALFTIAYALHFVVNDNGMARRHRARYRRTGRWLLSAAIVAGWLLGLATGLSEEAVHVLFALLAGGTILNVMKEELPEELESRLAPFVGGAAGYTALMLAL